MQTSRWGVEAIGLGEGLSKKGGKYYLASLAKVVGGGKQGKQEGVLKKKGPPAAGKALGGENVTAKRASGNIGKKGRKKKGTQKGARGQKRAGKNRTQLGERHSDSQVKNKYRGKGLTVL